MKRQERDLAKREFMETSKIVLSEVKHGAKEKGRLTWGLVSGRLVKMLTVLKK